MSFKPPFPFFRRCLGWTLFSVAAAVASAQQPGRGPAGQATAKTELPAMLVLGGGPAGGGWAAELGGYFDRTKVAITTRALAPKGDWNASLAGVKSGDVVLIAFGNAAWEGKAPDKPLPGFGDDTREIAGKPAGTIHSLGWQERWLVTEAKTLGARPIVISPPASAPDKAGRIERDADGFVVWAAGVAKAEQVPFVNLSKLTGDRYEPMGAEVARAGFKGNSGMVSAAGARVNVELLVSGLKGLRDQSLIRALSASGRALPVADPDNVFVVVQPPPRNPPEDFQRWLNLPEPGSPALPDVFLIGDSTVRNGRGDGYDLQFGWGDPFADYFDPTKVNVVNRAVGGTGVRTFIASGYWDRVVAMLKPGDVVLMQFGHNNDSLAGIGDDEEERTNARTGQKELQHSFGWYLRKYVADTRAKGATPILCSLVPRKTWRDGKIVRSKETFAGWAGQVATAEKVAFLDLNENIARRYDIMGMVAVDQLFADANTHTNWPGAVLNAGHVVAALKALPDNPVQRWLKDNLVK